MSPEILSVVGDRVEIERTALQPSLEARRMRDRLPLGEAVGRIRTLAHVEEVGIERVLGMDVKVAEVGVAQRIRRRALPIVGDGVGAVGLAGGAAKEDAQGEDHEESRRTE